MTEINSKETINIEPVPPSGKIEAQDATNQYSMIEIPDINMQSENIKIGLEFEPINEATLVSKEGSKKWIQ